MAMNPNLKNLLAGIEDPYIVFASGITPESIESAVRSSIMELNLEDRKGLGLAFILAAVGQRSTLTEMLSESNFRSVSRYIMKHFALRGQVNYSAINLGGNMIVAAHGVDAPKIITSWRTKLGFRSLWHCNFDSPTCRLSDKAKAIAREKVARFPMAEVIKYGTSVILLLLQGSDAPAINDMVLPTDGVNSQSFFNAVNQGNIQYTAERPLRYFDPGQTSNVVPRTLNETLNEEALRYTRLIAQRESDRVATEQAAALAANLGTGTGTNLDPNLPVDSQIIPPVRPQRVGPTASSSSTRVLRSSKRPRAADEEPDAADETGTDAVSRAEE